MFGATPILPPLILNLQREITTLLRNNVDVNVREAESLLQAIEQTMSHGIRAGSAFSHSPTSMDQVLFFPFLFIYFVFVCLFSVVLKMQQVWSYVKYIPTYLAGTESLIEEIRANREIETDMGRSRSWIRACLNHMCLGEHLTLLLADKDRTEYVR